MLIKGKRNLVLFISKASVIRGTSATMIMGKIMMMGSSRKRGSSLGGGKGSTSNHISIQDNSKDNKIITINNRIIIINNRIIIINNNRIIIRNSKVMI